MAMGAWCALRSEPKPAEPTSEEPDGEAPEEDQEEVAPQEVGCDAGAAVALFSKSFSQGTASLIGALGTHSMGFGIAWTVRRTRFSVAVGLAMPYDEGGIYSGEAEPVVGATVRFR